MAKSGYIKEVKYSVDAGVTWNTLGVIPPSAVVGTTYALAITWENTGDEAFQGHLGLGVTKPSALVTSITASSGQNASVAAGGEKEIIFNAFTLDEVGVYAGEMVLTEHGETTVYDENTAQLVTATAVPVPTPGIDLGEIMNLMITMMIVGMMMKMMTGIAKP